MPYLPELRLPAPTNLTVFEGAGVIGLTWERPRLSPHELANYSHAEVWRSDNADFSNAVLLGNGGNSYNDFDVSYGTDKIGITKYYRVRFLSYASTGGAFSKIVSGKPKDTRGVGKVVGICFKRAALDTTWSTANLPKGGSFDNPTADGWSDGVPEEKDGLPAWWTARTFTSTGLATDGQDAAWSTPVLLSNTSSTKYMYHTSTSVTPPTLPSTPTSNGTVTTTNGWTDTPSTTTVWAAVSTMSNGTWSAFVAYKIKGEKGDAGKDGEDGRDGADGGVVYTGYIYWNSVTSAPTTNPSGGAVSVNATGGTSWTVVPPGWSLNSPSMGASGGTIYYSRFTVSADKNTTGNIPTYTDFAAGFNFSSLVTFTDLSNPGMQTTIHGGNIATNSIKADSIESFGTDYASKRFAFGGTMGGYSGAAIGWNPAASGAEAGVIGGSNFIGVVGLGFSGGSGGFFGRVAALPSGTSVGSYVNTVELATASYAGNFGGSVNISGSLSVTSLTVNGVAYSSTGATYTLPTASSTTKGGIKVGDGLQIRGETLAVTTDVLRAADTTIVKKGGSYVVTVVDNKNGTMTVTF
jgi:hypothetical protein